MTLREISGRRRLGRGITGMAALLLPYTADGEIAVDAFQACLEETWTSGLTPAVNMDTGYVNLLEDAEKAQVLEWTREAARGRPFVAGAFVEGSPLELVEAYRLEIGRIVDRGGTPILFQTSRMHPLTGPEKAGVYSRAVRDFGDAYAFELGPVFAPNGEIWDLETFDRILNIPEIVGAKHSSLNRRLELQRLEVRDRYRPEFRVLTGNDLGIDMIEYGSDYLLGLAAFSPRKFAERDRLWEEEDPAYHDVADALQFLGNVAFRPPVPAYKHSAAIFLHMLGKIPSPRTHPRSMTRPSWEGELLASCIGRLGLT